ncbi:unnamed protein product [Calicophoron daubneyi]|uniref:Uncharacterized protein n=1 Tax=Calicophoron daubneyi TaxID=300641 RepID=A0AAV2T155_CALDB
MPSLVDRFQRFVDNHLQVVRIIPPLLGFSGLFLISKHYYLFTRFRTVSSVPVEVFTRRLRLRGIVRSVEADGEVQVEHIPRLAFFNNSTGASRMPLLLPLTHSEKSVAWMRANLPVNSRVRFVLLGKSDDSTRLIGLVFYRRVILGDSLMWIRFRLCCLFTPMFPNCCCVMVWPRCGT